MPKTESDLYANQHKFRNLLKEKVDWDLPTVEELPTVTVQGKIISKEGQSGTKSVFQVTTLEGVQFCSVEELVKLHYRLRAMLKI